MHRIRLAGSERWLREQVREREHAHATPGFPEQFAPVDDRLVSPAMGTLCLKHVISSIDVQKFIEPEQRLTEVGDRALACLFDGLVRLAGFSLPLL